jgi:hypothetical protein
VAPFFLQGVVEVAEQATGTARSILTLRDQRRELIQDSVGVNGLRLCSRWKPGGSLRGRCAVMTPPNLMTKGPYLRQKSRSGRDPPTSADSLQAGGRLFEPGTAHSRKRWK